MAKIDAYIEYKTRKLQRKYKKLLPLVFEFAECVSDYAKMHGIAVDEAVGALNKASNYKQHFKFW